MKVTIQELSGLTGAERSRALHSLVSRDQQPSTTRQSWWQPRLRCYQRERQPAPCSPQRGAVSLQRPRESPEPLWGQPPPWLKLWVCMQGRRDVSSLAARSPPQAGAILLQRVQGAAGEPAALRHASGAGCGLSETPLDITSGQSSERDHCCLGCVSHR